MTIATPSVVRSATPLEVWRRLRLPVVLALLVLVTAFGVTYFRARATSGELDPTSVSPAGSRAVAELLRERGVAIRRVTAPLDSPGGTVFVPFAGDLSPAELLRLTYPKRGGHVVLVAPSGGLQVLGVNVTSSSDATRAVREPGCAFAAAVTAGRADAGGLTYQVEPVDGFTIHTCYAAGGQPTLVRIEAAYNTSVTIVGSAQAFTNDRLAEEGDAALALGLLDHGTPVTWMMRKPAGSASGDEVQGLFTLLPDGVYWGLLQLVIAAVVAMVWRGRRLGPVITEPLPVVVRAAEAVEGRGRLYAAGKARGRAGWNLRRGARARLRTRLGLTADTTDDALVQAAAARASRAPADVGRLLYGPDPVDDAGLVRLAADLDHFDSEVRRS